MNIFTRKNQSIGTQFLMMINLVIFVTVIFMALYYMFVTNRLNIISQTEEDFKNKAISNLVFETARIDLETNNYQKLNKITKSLIQNNLITYVATYEKKKPQKVTWSTISNIKGKTVPINNLTTSYIKSLPFSFIDPQNVKVVQGNTGKHIVIVGYEAQPVLVSYLNSIIENNKILALTFLFLGFVCAILMVRVVTEPIKHLASGVKIFSSGNLKHKIPQTKYTEINLLVDAFNEMAHKLDAVYTSLEDKVKERTQEVVEKNKELKNAYNELQEAQSMMVHSEKMRSLGELVAGITHEINNPVNFIYGNLIHLNNYSKDLVEIIEKYQEVENKLPDEDKKELSRLKEELEFDFIKDDLPDLIKSCKEGTERTKNIILDLKSFSRADELIVNEIDLHKEINTSLNILYNKYKDNINIHKEFSEIPSIDCYGGQINQVFLNILDNAIFAIEKEGDIFIRTKTDDKYVVIEIEDTGKGMSQENVKKIFEPFYTTKSVGEGTGLGMSISYKVIQNHNGIIEVESEVGKGTKFIVKLPKEGVKKQLASKD